MPKTDREIAQAAIDATGLSNRAFAELIHMDERRLRRVIEGDEGISGCQRKLCRLIARYPQIAIELGEEE